MLVKNDVEAAGKKEDQAQSPLYGVSDEERDRMLEWAREWRLPLFMRSENGGPNSEG